MENRWIQVSERLPEKEDKYLITRLLGSHYDVTEGWFYIYPGGITHWPVTGKVIAWMPYPKPYKEENQNERVSD